MTVKPIPGFAYSVSDKGEVFSNKTGKQIKPQPTRKGYHRVCLWREGEKLYQFVHCLVLLAFVGPRPDGCETRHKDGSRINNVLDNLEWATPSVNNRDKHLHQTMANGTRNGAHKLTEEQVHTIREAKRTGGKYWGRARLAAEFGVDLKTIRNVASGKVRTAPAYPAIDAAIAAKVHDS